MSNAGYNPYQAPQASLMAQIVPGTDIWQEGNLLVLRKGAVLPDRCVKCNAPAESYRLKRTLYWHHPAIYLTILVSLLIYIIIAVIVRHSLVTEVGLCQRHKSKRRMGIAIAWLMCLGAIGVLFLGANARGPDGAVFFIASPVLLVAGLLVAIFTAPIVRAKRIDAYFGWLKGVCPEYLAELPPSPVRR